MEYLIFLFLSQTRPSNHTLISTQMEPRACVSATNATVHGPQLDAPASSTPNITTSTSGLSKAMATGGTTASTAVLAARVLGPAAAAVAELSLFHPVDTVVKRLMAHHGPVFPPNLPASESIAHASRIALREAASPGVSLLSRARALYSGVFYAFGHKVAQRTYKFGGQPFIREALHDSGYTAWLQKRLSPSAAHVLADGTAGSFIGLGEVILLPLDVLKIKAQTNMASLGGRSLPRLLMAEGPRLYAGASWTAARNIPGSFTFFGGTAWVQEYIYKARGRKMTLAETASSVAVGCALSIIVSSPMDVIKTRVQAADFSRPTSGWSVVRDIVRNEGVSAFAHGLTPKLLTVGPKLIFSYTVAHMLTSRVGAALGVDMAAKGSTPKH